MATYDPQNNPLLTDEDRAALERVGRQTGRHQAVRHIREAGLKPWMRSFAAWYALEGNALSRTEQLVKCRYFAKDRIRPHSMNALFKREDFQALIERYTEHSTDALRAQLEALAPAAIDAEKKAIAWAVEREDYKAIPAVIEPVLSRTISKKDETPQRPPILIVNLGSGFAQQYAEAPMQECEVEELPPPESGEEKN